MPDQKPANGQSQHGRFVETARKLECDEDKERFEMKLGRLAKATPTREGAVKSPPLKSKR